MNERLEGCRVPARRPRAGDCWLGAHGCLASPVRPSLAVRGDDVVDLSPVAATASALFELDDPVAAVRDADDLPRLAPLAETLANSAWNRRSNATPWFLAPCDLQAIKASGVTFISSMLERVIEEQAQRRSGAERSPCARRSSR